MSSRIPSWSHRSAYWPRTFAFFLLLACSSWHSVRADWAEPERFFEGETIERRELAPGVTWIAAKGTREGHLIQSQILAIDLREPSLELRTLLGARQKDATTSQFFSRSRVSQLHRDYGALAAINATFFDIRATQSPTGLVMSHGMVIREPSPSRPSFLYHPGGKATLATPDWKAQVRVAERRRPLAAVNRPALSGDEVVLYVGPWRRTQGIGSGHLEGETLTEILVEKSDFLPATGAGEQSRLVGRIREIRYNQPSKKLQKDEFVLAAPQKAAPFFRDAKIGDEVEVQWELLNAPGEWREWTEIISAGPILFQNGEWKPKEVKSWLIRHPRTAIGIDKSGERLLLVVVDGRSDLSVGMDFNTLAQYLYHLGAHQALNLDGGGSSAMSAIVDGKARTLNRPSDIVERYVPTGLGVFIKDDPQE